MAQYINKADVVAELEKLYNLEYDNTSDLSCGKKIMLRHILHFLDALEVKEVDFERDLSKYVSNGIHRFFPNVNDDYCKMDSVVWQDYVIETAKYFFELGLKAKGD